MLYIPARPGTTSTVYASSVRTQYSNKVEPLVRWPTHLQYMPNVCNRLDVCQHSSTGLAQREAEVA